MACVCAELARLGAISITSGSVASERDPAPTTSPARGEQIDCNSYQCLRPNTFDSSLGGSLDGFGTDNPPILFSLRGPYALSQPVDGQTLNLMRWYVLDEF